MTAPVKVITPPLASVTTVDEGLLKSMSPAAATSSAARLPNMVGEGAKVCGSAACRPLGTPSSTNLSAAGAAGAGAAAPGLPDFASIGFGSLAAIRCTE